MYSMDCLCPRDGAICAADMAMAAPILGGGKWWWLELIITTMRAYHPGPARSFCFVSRLPRSYVIIIRVSQSHKTMRKEW